MGLAEGFDWVGRAQTLWVFVPTWVKLAMVYGVTTALGFFDGLPLSAIFVLSLFALAFGAIFVAMINDVVQAAIAQRNRIPEIKKQLADYAMMFFRLEGQCKNRVDVERQAIEVFNEASRFLDENVGYVYAAELKMADRPSVPGQDMGLQRDLLLRLQGRKEYLQGLINRIDSAQLKR